MSGMFWAALGDDRVDVNRFLSRVIESHVSRILQSRRMFSVLVWFVFMMMVKSVIRIMIMTRDIPSDILYSNSHMVSVYYMM